jgi:hypothetical protein
MPTGQAVEAIQTWLAAASITEGLVFRSVLKGGRVQPGHLPARVVATIGKRYTTVPVSIPPPTPATACAAGS